MPRKPENNAAYMREYRARKAEEAKTADQREAERRRAILATEGAVERTVREACEKWPKALEQPETVAIALELARVMDEGASTAKTQASAQLTRILDSLRGGSTHGKLAQLREGAVRERDS